MDAYPREVRTVAVVGLGTIGMSWAAYFLGRGLSVRATDVDPAAEARSIRRSTVACESRRHWSSAVEKGRLLSASERPV